MIPFYMWITSILLGIIVFGPSIYFVFTWETGYVFFKYLSIAAVLGLALIYTVILSVLWHVAFRPHL